MIEVIPTAAQIREAQESHIAMGEIAQSIRRGEGNLYGFLGELIVAARFGCKMESTAHYDMVSAKGATIDVKTKVTTVKPQPTFECSIVAYQKQTCDLFVFVRILDNLTRAWILGYITPAAYFAAAAFRRKGELDPNSSKHRPFRFTADCYNLPIAALTPLT